MKGGSLDLEDEDMCCVLFREKRGEEKAHWGEEEERRKYFWIF